MNTTQIVRTDVTESGVMLRLWIDDAEGRHLAVAELPIGMKTLRHWLGEWDREQNKRAQQQFPE